MPLSVHSRSSWSRLIRLDRVPSLLLRAHEEDRASPSGDLADEVLGLREQPLGLLEVDDVDPAALAEDVAAHAGVPAPSLVAEVDPGLKQVLDPYVGHVGSFLP